MNSQESKTVEELLSAVGDILQSAQERLAKAEASKYQQPYRTELQNDRPCCECGTIIPRDTVVVVSHLPLHVGEFLTSQFIAWCNTCWQNHFGTFGKVRDMTIGGAHKE